MVKKRNKSRDLKIEIISVLLAGITVFVILSLTFSNLGYIQESGAIGDIIGMHSVPSQVIPDQTVSVWVRTKNVGESGELWCKWYNADTLEELGSRTLNFNAGSIASFIRDVTVPAGQTGTFNVKAEVGHESIIDDTETLAIPIAVESYTVTITVLDNETSLPVSGARVDLGANSKNTNYNGEVEFTVTSGTYPVDIMHIDYWNYQTPSGQEIIVSNADVERDFYIKPLDDGGNGGTGGTGGSTPGFGLIISVIAIGIILLIKTQRRKR